MGFHFLTQNIIVVAKITTFLTQTSQHTPYVCCANHKLRALLYIIENNSPVLKTNYTLHYFVQTGIGPLKFDSVCSFRSESASDEVDECNQGSVGQDSQASDLRCKCIPPKPFEGADS